MTDDEFGVLGAEQALQEAPKLRNGLVGPLPPGITQVTAGRLFPDKVAEAKLLAERRERISTAVLQGLVANHGTNVTPRAVVSKAVEVADTLIAELDRRK